ncbi:Amuc_1099 family pilus-like system protein [Pontiella agarivorans]|uniref:Uncharacterized protein n=1 Tax=Pontiella agarivorans TaxID=3038953 RepID=A0ABU5MUU0_9BACT|nr:Amuc_1099 family pilus-like system protein [Pontiella agarivorans]MDZ8117963.1 hypothetical protein [Pontiella agarivorans]
MKLNFDWLLFGGLLTVLLLSCGIAFTNEAAEVPVAVEREAPLPKFQPPEDVKIAMDGVGRLFTGSLRVVAVGSAYPIPYEAKVCPFSNIPQPGLDQLDHDGDGMTDDWEKRFGLDRYNKADALSDADGDGFTNLEEFKASTDPLLAAIHPPYAGKLRFVERKDIDFPLVFQGFMEQSDGTIIFQLNNPSTGKSHFAAIGDAVEHVVLQRFKMDENGRDHRLYVMRDGIEIELLRGKTALDPESTAELINILDRTPIIVTMGALLSLHNDKYTVLGVYADRVLLKDTASGEVYDIVGFTGGDR